MVNGKRIKEKGKIDLLNRVELLNGIDICLFHHPSQLSQLHIALYSA
jgi:hypothetical protein